jgi:hypothetical protein
MMHRTAWSVTNRIPSFLIRRRLEKVINTLRIHRIIVTVSGRVPVRDMSAFGYSPHWRCVRGVTLHNTPRESVEGVVSDELLAGVL